MSVNFRAVKHACRMRRPANVRGRARPGGCALTPEDYKQRALPARALRLALSAAFAGERDTALAKARQLADALGEWDRLPGIEPPPWRMPVADLPRQPQCPNGWEQQFLASISAYPPHRDLSEKQTTRLAGTTRKTGARTGAAA